MEITRRENRVSLSIRIRAVYEEKLPDLFRCEREGWLFTDDLVRNICKDEVDIELDVADIDRSHGLGSAPSGGIHDMERNDREWPKGEKRETRNIIVKFTNYRAREKIYDDWMKLRHSANFLYINKNLTRDRTNLVWRIKKGEQEERPQNMDSRRSDRREII